MGHFFTHKKFKTHCALPVLKNTLPACFVLNNTNQGCGAGVTRSRVCWPESELESESVKLANSSTSNFSAFGSLQRLSFFICQGFLNWFGTIMMC